MNVSIVMRLLDNVTGPIRRVQQAVASASRQFADLRDKNAKTFELAANIKHASDGVLAFAAKTREAIGVTVTAAAQFEMAMLGVAKQVDGARDASGKLTPIYFDMAKQIQLLGREVPMATTALAEMAAAGARMGVAKDELIEFTRTSAMMAEAFEVPAGQLAEQMGKIKGLFGLQTQKEVTALADAVNFLDDNAISKGGDIIEFLQRTGGVASSVKVTATQMAALGSTLLTLGEQPMMAGTAVNSMVQKFASATKGTANFRETMRLLGLSTREVQMGMQSDAQGTILKVFDAINNLSKENRAGALVDLFGLEHSDTMAKLAGNVAEYRKQIAMANSETAKGSMSREFQARLQTTNAQWEIMKNRATELGVNVGSVLLPVINKLLAVVGPLASRTADWVKENPKLVATLAGVAAAVAVASTAIGGLMAATAALVATKGLIVLAGGFAAIAAPAIVAGIAIGTVTLAIIELVKAWESLDALEVLDGIGAVFAQGAMDGTGGTTAVLKQMFDPRALMESIGVIGGKAADTIGSASAPDGLIKVHIDSEGRPSVKQVQANGIELEASAGVAMSN